METSLGRRVSALREREKLTQAQLSKKLECPRSRICKLENVDTYQPPKQYPLEFVRKLCNVLARNDTEISELFELSGHKAPPRDDILRIVRIMEDTLSSADLNQFSEELIAEVEAFVIAWGVMRQARRQKVTKVVVVAAGWQPRLLAPQLFEQTLLPAVDEAARAGIFEVLLVVPPNTPDLKELKQTFPNSVITYVIQQEPLGIGNAILTAIDHIEGQPFALVLADEIDESRTALRNLVKAYNDFLRPLVAVDAYEPDEEEAVLRYYGFARLGSQKQQNVFTLEAELEEKPEEPPSRGHLRIAGRYILTPEIVRALQSTKYVQQGPIKHDLTAAINQLWRASASVLAYKLPQRMVSIAPYRDVIQKMSASAQRAPRRVVSARKAR